MEGSSKTTLPATTVPVMTRISQCYSVRAVFPYDAQRNVACLKLDAKNRVISQTDDTWLAVFGPIINALAPFMAS